MNYVQPLKVYYVLCTAPKSVLLCTRLLQITLHFVFRSTPSSIPNSVYILSIVLADNAPPHKSVLYTVIADTDAVLRFVGKLL